MKIYGNPGSTCTRKVLTTFAEKGVTPAMEILDLGKREQKLPAHVARQPFGQVPVLEDGDFRVYESRAIIRYLDEVLPGPALTPADAKGRALMDQWISIETSNFTPHAMAIIYQAVLGPMRGQTPDLEKLEEAKVKLAPTLAVLDAQLEGRSFILGETFSLADVCFMPYVEYLMLTPAAEMITTQKNVGTWWERVRNRASWKTATGKT